MTMKKYFIILMMLVMANSAVTAQTIKPGTYYIRLAKNNNYALAFKNNEEGKTIACIKKWEKVKAQQWKVVKENGGISIRRASNEQAALDVEDFVYESGSNIQLFDHHGGDNQVWVPSSKGSNRYILKSKGKKTLCLAANNESKLSEGLSVRLRQASGKYPKEWIFQAVEKNDSESSSTQDMRGTKSHNDSFNGIIFKSGDLQYKILTSTTCEVTNRVTSIRKGNITVPKTVTHKGVRYTVVGLAYGCLSNEIKMTSVSLPNTLEYIGEKAFMGTPIKTIYISGSPKVMKYAFKNCTKLTNVHFADTGWSFSTYAFDGCKNLNEVRLHTQRKAKDFEFKGASPKRVNVYW